jgi:hypothetical protein
MADKHLVVVTPFADYAAGDRITDDALIDAIWGGEQRPFVNVVAPAPAPVETEEHAE